MKHTWKLARRRLVQTVTLMALLVLMRDLGEAQTLAFQPGITSLVAGDPETPLGATTTPSSASYAGPANGYVPDSRGGGIYNAVTDISGNVYVVESNGNIVRVIASGNGPIPSLPTVTSPQAGYVYTVFGTGVTSSGSANPVDPNCTASTGKVDNYGDGCLATQAILEGSLGSPIAVDSKGNLYIVDQNAGLIRIVYAGGTNNPLTSFLTAETGIGSPTQGYVYSVAGMVDSGGYTATSAGTAATGTQIGYPEAVAVDPNGNIFFSTYDGNTGGQPLLAVSVSGSLPGNSSPTPGYVYTIVGETGTARSGVSVSGFSFGAPYGLAADSSGNIYVADSSADVVWGIYVAGSLPGLTNVNPGYVYAVAGGGTTNTFSTFAPAPATQFFMRPVEVTVDGAGNLYVTDDNGNKIEKVDPSGNLTMVYGKTTDTSGYTCATVVDVSQDGCAADVAATSYPSAVAVDPQGNIYVPDQNDFLHESNVTTSSLYFTSGQTQKIAIYNTSGDTQQPLTVTSVVASSGSGFTVVPISPPTGTIADCSTGPTLAPGESCETSIQAPASSTAEAKGTLTVTSNATNGANGNNIIQLTVASSLTGTTTTLSTTPPSSIPTGTTESLAFSVSGGTGQSSAFPTGSLTLYDNGSPLASVSALTVSNPSASPVTYTFNQILLPTGNNFVYAVYSGDTNYRSSQSSQALITVSGAASTTTLAATPNPAATGATVTLTAKVMSTSGNPSDGSVTFKSGNTVIPGSPVAVSGGSASITTTAPSTAGTDTFTASYAGSTTYNPSASNAVQVTVTAPVATTTSVTPSSTAPTEGAPVTLTATVTATSGTAAPTGSVTFFDGGTSLGTGALTAIGTTNAATASYTANALSEGKNTITASYSGSSDGLFQTSNSNATPVTVTVGLPATTTTVNPPTGSITYGSSYTFTVAVAQQVGNTVPSGIVTFTAGTTNLGTATVTSGTATFTTTQLPGGSSTLTDTVTATFNDPSNNFASSTGTASVSVTPVGTTTSTPTSSNLNPVSGQTLTLTATVAATGSSVQPTGTVTFYNNGTLFLCSATLTSGAFSCPTSLLPQGADSVTAVFAGGNGFTTSTSPALSLTVAPPSASTATALMASTTTASTTQPVTFTATVTNTTTGSTGIPTGVVTFQSGSTVLGTGSLSVTGVATYTTTFTKIGAYPVIAIYQGNSSYTGSTSPTPVNVTVTQALAMSTTSLTLSTSAVQQGSNVTFTATVAPTSTSTTITPTGTVTFYNGGQQIPNSTSTLNGGIATFSVATLNAGTYSVTAEYSGDVNYSGSSSTASPLTVGAPTPSFTLTATPANLTLTSGQSGAAIITLVPTYSYTGTVALSCGTLPANVTCSFSPATLTADGKNDAVQSTLTITTNGTTAQMRDGRPTSKGHNSPILAAFAFLPLGLLGLGFVDKRKRLGGYLPLAFLALLSTGLLVLSGCGGGNGGSTTDAAKGAAQITVTGTGSAGSQTQTANLTITIQ